MPSKSALAVEPALWVSFSAADRFRTCEQDYYYDQVEKLERKDRAVPLERGIILATYLELYYKNLQHDYSAPTAHASALVQTMDEYRSKVGGYAVAAEAAGDLDLATELRGMLDVVPRIAERYFETRGEQDALTYEVLQVECWVDAELAPDVGTRGKVDLITRDRSNGRISLWEHKTVGEIPALDRRLRDLQTLLYRRPAEKRYGFMVDSVTWNYLRTKEPTIPDVLKNGGLSKRKDLDTTWEVYLELIKEHELDVNDYAEICSRLGLNREADAFFPRHELPMVAREDVLLRDFTATAVHIQQRRKEWDEGGQPIRSVGYRCVRCTWRHLCTAVILGGDAESVKLLRYKQRAPSPSGNAPAEQILREEVNVHDDTSGGSLSSVDFGISFDGGSDDLDRWLADLPAGTSQSQ